MVARRASSGSPSIRTAAILLLAVAAPAACIERKERITLHADGRVDMIVSADATDAADPDAPATPAADDGWLIEQALETRGEDEVPVVVASRSFEWGDALPAHYATGLEENDREPLRFPTAVAMEPVRGGTVYRFRRVYPPRPWAFVDYEYRRIVAALEKTVGEGEDAEDLTPAQRIEAIKAFVRGEAQKVEQFARQAFLDVTPDAPDEAWLLARSALRACLDEIDYGALEAAVREIEALAEGEEREERTRRELDRLRETMRDRLRAGLREHAGYGGTRLRRFDQRYDFHERSFRLTDTLGAYRFTITLEMPGEIVASNADSVQGRTLTWQVAGDSMRDRTVELMATSLLPGDP
jgi:hypothetical protein